MTVVADLVAQLRVEAGGFNDGFHQAEAAVHKFGEEVRGTSEHVLRVKEIAGTAALAIGGSFAAMAATVTEAAFSFTKATEGMQVQWQALLGTAGAADNQIDKIRAFSNEFGLMDGQVASASRSLQTLTQGVHNDTQTMTAMANAAAATGQSIDSMASRFGYLYEILQAGGQNVSYIGRELIRLGLITQTTMDTLQSMAQKGAAPDAIWTTLMSSLTSLDGTAAHAADTFSGLKTSLHSLFDERVGTMFGDVLTGVEHVMKAVKDLGESQGIKQVTEEIRNKVDGLLPHFDSLAAKIGHLGDRISVGGLDDIIAKVKDMAPAFGTLAGAVAEFGTEIVGEMPILNRFMGTIVNLFDDGRGAILGFLLSTKETRDAIGNLVSSLVELATSAEGLLSTVNAVEKAIAPFVAMVINAAAAVVDFVGHNKVLIDVLAAVVVAWEGLKIINSIIDAYKTVSKAVRTFASDVVVLSDNLVYKKKAEEDSIATEQAANAVSEQRTQALRQQAAAAREAAAAEGQLTTPGLEAPTATAAEAQVRQLSMFGRGLSNPAVMAGVGVLGATAAVVGQQTGNTPLSVVGGIAGMASSGAMVGSAFGPEGTIIGGAIGGIVGLATSIFNLGNAASDAQAKIDKINNIKSGISQDTGDVDKTSLASMRNAYTYAQRELANKPGELLSQIQGDTSIVDKATGRSAQIDPWFLQHWSMSELKDRYTLSPQAQSLIQQYKDWNSTGGSQEARDKILGPLNTSLGRAMGNEQSLLKEFGGTMNPVTGNVEGGQATQAIIEQAAKANGISLDFDPSTLAGQQAMEKLHAAVEALIGPAGQAADRVAELTRAMDAAATAGSGVLGNPTWTVPTGLLTQNADVKAAEGRDLPTKAVLDEQARLLDVQQRNASVAQGVASAQHGLTEAYWAQHEALIALDVATRSASEAQRKMRFDLQDQQVAVDHFNSVLNYQADNYSGLQAALRTLAPEHQALGEEVAAMIPAVNQMATEVDNLTRAYQQQQDHLTTLTDTEKQFQDILDKPLQGTSRYDTLIHQNQMAQDAIQLQIDRLKQQWVYDQDPRLMKLNEQLATLKNTGDQLNLQKSLDIGDKQFQLDKVAKDQREITFDTALQAAKNVGELKTQVNDLTSQMDPLKVQLDTVNESYDIAKQRTDSLYQALQGVATADESVRTQNFAVIDSLNSLAGAQHGVEQATWGIHDAMIAVQNATLAYARNAIQAEQDLVNQTLEAMKNTAQYAAVLIAGMIRDSNFQQSIADAMQQSTDTVMRHYGYIPDPNGGAPSKAYAAGGIVNSRTFAMVGEAGPEVVIPLTDPARAYSLAKESGLFNILGHHLGAGPLAGSYASPGGLTIGQGAVMVEINVHGDAPANIGEEVKDAVDKALGDLVDHWNMHGATV